MFLVYTTSGDGLKTCSPGRHPGTREASRDQGPGRHLQGCIRSPELRTAGALTSDRHQERSGGILRAFKSIWDPQDQTGIQESIQGEHQESTRRAPGEHGSRAQARAGTIFLYKVLGGVL